MRMPWIISMRKKPLMLSIPEKQDQRLKKHGQHKKTFEKPWISGCLRKISTSFHKISYYINLKFLNFDVAWAFNNGISEFNFLWYCPNNKVKFCPIELLILFFIFLWVLSVILITPLKYLQIFSLKLWDKLYKNLNFVTIYCDP